MNIKLAKEIAPFAGKWDAENLFPPELWPKLGEMGLLGVTAPGKKIFVLFFMLKASFWKFTHCLNQRNTEVWVWATWLTAWSWKNWVVPVLVNHWKSEERKKNSWWKLGIALSYGAHSNLCVNQLVRHATKEQKAKHLTGVCSMFFKIVTSLDDFIAHRRNQNWCFGHVGILKWFGCRVRLIDNDLFQNDGLNLFCFQGPWKLLPLKRATCICSMEANVGSPMGRTPMWLLSMPRRNQRRDLVVSPLSS